MLIDCEHQSWQHFNLGDCCCSCWSLRWRTIQIPQIRLIRWHEAIYKVFYFLFGHCGFMGIPKVLLRFFSPSGSWSTTFWFSFCQCIQYKKVNIVPTCTPTEDLSLWSRLIRRVLRTSSQTREALYWLGSSFQSCQEQQLHQQSNKTKVGGKCFKNVR